MRTASSVPRTDVRTVSRLATLMHAISSTAAIAALQHGEQSRRVAVQLLLEAEHLGELAARWCPDTPRRAPRAMPFERILRLRDRDAVA